MSGIFGRINVETPVHKLLKKTGDYEIRHYPSMIMASTPTGAEGTDSYVASNGFRSLANYIFGGNKSKAAAGGKEAISMTAPVLTDSSKMYFVLPGSKYNSTSELPEPLSGDVEFTEIKDAVYATCYFTGTASKESFIEQRDKLLKALLTDDEYKVKVDENGEKEVFLARYNAPWTLPFLRTNEVFLRVETK